MAHNLSFDDKELDYLANVLAQRPYAEVAPLLAKIQQQVAEQQEGERGVIHFPEKDSADG
jgi:hypothetical protein